MGGGGQQGSQTTVQQSKTEPWEPAQPLLKDLLAKYGALPTDVTDFQQSALNKLQGAVSGVPSFGAEGTDAVRKMFNLSTAPQVGMLNDSFGLLSGNIGGTASGAELDPWSTPGFSGALDTLGNDITTRIKGVYNASGRDPSGAGSFAGSLGRGLEQGLAPVVQAQFNQNKANQMAAAKTLYDAGTGTSGAITAQNQIPIANSLQGLNSIGLLSNALTQPAMTQLGAANQVYQAPYGNLAQLLQPAATIGGLGGSSSGTSTTTASQPTSMMSNIMGGVTGMAALLPMMFSDERLKENKERVGTLYDGMPVWAFNYKGDPTPRVGLMAHEVEERHPEAVAEVGGFKAVDYAAATSDARAIGGMLTGMLNDNDPTENRKAA